MRPRATAEEYTYTHSHSVFFGGRIKVMLIKTLRLVAYLWDEEGGIVR